MRQLGNQGMKGILEPSFDFLWSMKVVLHPPPANLGSFAPVSEPHPF